MYRSENMNWRFTVPQAGEVDSVERVESMLSEIDDALIGPMKKAELTSNGNWINPDAYTDGDSSSYSTVPDEYWSAIEGRSIYTTKSHYHPIPTIVVKSESSNTSSFANVSDTALSAAKLNPGIKLNGKTLTGEIGQQVTLTANDIPDVPRVFWGPNPPSSASVASPRRGDIYVQVY